MTFLATWPFLKRIIVGIERTSKFAAVCWFSSTLSLTMRRSSRSEAISSSTGATTRHGPHQGAQKSTRTGPSDSRTSAWKLLSVTSMMLAAMRGSFGGFASERIETKWGEAPDGLERDAPRHLRVPFPPLVKDNRHLGDAQAAPQSTR